MTPTVRLATANLLHGRSLRGGALDLPGAAAALAALSADVVAVQEVDRGLARTGGVDQVAWLARRLGWHGVFAPALLGDPDHRWRPVAGGGAAPDTPEPGYGIGLLSRWPLEAVRRVALPGGGQGHRPPARAAAARRRPPVWPGWDREPRAALSAVAVVSGRALRVTTTHLTYLPWRALRQLRVAAAAAGADAGPAVLLGDLNLPAWPVRLALGRRWTPAVGPPTYPADRPRLRADQALVTGGVTVQAVRTAPTTSDHLILVVAVRLPAR